MGSAPRDDGLRLLRLMNANQAHGSEQTPVSPAQAAMDLGLDLGSDRYEEALRFLLDEEALNPEERFGEVPAGWPPGGSLVYQITPRGFEMLEQR